MNDLPGVKNLSDTQMKILMLCLDGDRRDIKFSDVEGWHPEWRIDNIDWNRCVEFSDQFLRVWVND